MSFNEVVRAEQAADRRRTAAVTLCPLHRRARDNAKGAWARLNQLRDRFLYITSTSKSTAPGIRIGYMLAPASAIERISVSVLRTMVNAPPAMAELATSLITDGVAGRIAEWKRKEMGDRQAIAARVLARLDVQTQPKSPASVGAPPKAVAHQCLRGARATSRHSKACARGLRARRLN
ncbi:MAG TPA: hypothetical protein VM115_04060 [Vicinamibacterales bacterium]|nr:hypothetical protein [Vicinamibacterales bacterium]